MNESINVNGTCAVSSLRYSHVIVDFNFKQLTLMDSI